MKTYRLEFIGEADQNQLGPMYNTYFFETSVPDRTAIKDVRAGLMTEVYNYFTWFWEPAPFRKYGRTRNGHENVFSWEEMAEIAADHGFKMALYVEL
ncbi:MAG: hypothetical protein LUC24_05340 [Bacteroidales bacterium]|nr:hypothetical protein [Bacteroidales bacterium]